jgi:hypothetical protein
MQISLSDWINIAQTVILLLTGGVIVLYTIETARIRKETSIQNTLLAEQLRLMQTAREQEVAKEMSFIKPYFRFGGGNSSADGASYEFTNKGGPAKKLISKPHGSFSVGVNPTRFIDTNEKGTVHIRANTLSNGEKYPFEISCIDKLSNEYTFRFYYQHHRGVLEDEST